MRIGKKEIDLGYKIHIVGKADSGKTTLAKLLIKDFLKRNYKICIFSDDYANYKDLENPKMNSKLFHQMKNNEVIFDIINKNNDSTFFVIDKPIFKLKKINELAGNIRKNIIFVSPEISYGSRSISPDSIKFDTVIVTNNIKILDSKLVQKIKRKFGFKIRYSLSLYIVKCRYCNEQHINLKFKK